MDELMKLVVLAVLGLALTVLLKRDVPPMALLVTVTLLVGLLLAALTALGEVNGFIQHAAEVASLSGDILVPLMKTVAIAILVRVFASLCRDAAESAIAAAVETVGAVTAVVVMLPLFNAVLSLCVQLVS